MYLHLKISGEVLCGPEETEVPWTAPELETVAANIAALREASDEIALEGLLIVTGAGNIIRGDKLEKKFVAAGRGNSTVVRNKDVTGRLGTLMNGVNVSSALTDANVPHVVLVAPGMSYSDSLFEGAEILPYTKENLLSAFEQELAAVAIGGTGKNNQTTDAAVMEYAMMTSAANEGATSLSLKATKYNGVFTGDPATDPHAMPFLRIPAALMDRYYEQFRAVDRPSLQIMMRADAERADVGLQVYANDYTPLEVLRARMDGRIIGSLVTSAQLQPELHEEFPVPIAA